MATFFCLVQTEEERYASLEKVRDVDTQEAVPQNVFAHSRLHLPVVVFHSRLRQNHWG